MSNDPTVSVKVKIADQTFRVRVAPEEQEFYERIAEFAEETYQEIAEHTVSGGAQAWAMTAFQIATELFECRQEMGSSGVDNDRIQRLIRRIEEVAPRG